MELKQYIRVIKRRWWIVLAIVIIACTASGIKSYYYTTPIYEANAKLIVNQASTVNNDAYPSIGVLQTNLMLIDSYMEIIRSSAILDKVVERYPQLQDSAYDMAQTLSVNSTNNSQVMNLTYVSTSYKAAAETVNAISNVFKEQIPFIMNVDNITILNEAKLDGSIPQDPINIDLIMGIIIAFVLSFMVGLGFVFLLYYLDDTFKSEEELKEVLGIPLLAAMSKMNKVDLRSPKSVKATLKNEVGEGKYASLNQ